MAAAIGTGRRRLTLLRRLGRDVISGMFARGPGSPIFVGSRCDVRSRATIAAQRGGHPAERYFTVLRISGAGDLWVSECVITYDGTPSYSVSIRESSGEFVAHETQYFADPFDAPDSRAALAEKIAG
ncbi:MAG TPA: hypothetical protein VH442_13670 [Micromonosporaceae bacterium]